MKGILDYNSCPKCGKEKATRSKLCMYCRSNLSKKKCVWCEKHFYISKSPYRQRALIIRPRRSQTCSKYCSKEWSKAKERGTHYPKYRKKFCDNCNKEINQMWRYKTQFLCYNCYRKKIHVLNFKDTFQLRKPRKK